MREERIPQVLTHAELWNYTLRLSERPTYRQPGELHGPEQPRPLVVTFGSRYLRAFNSRQLLTTGQEGADDLPVAFLQAASNHYCNQADSEGPILCTHAIDAATCAGRCTESAAI